MTGFQSTKLALAFRSFQQRKVVIAEFSSQLVGLLVMLVIGYFTRSIWSLVAAGLAATMVSTTLSHVWFHGPANRLQWDSSALKELIAFGRWVLLSSAVGGGWPPMAIVFGLAVACLRRAGRLLHCRAATGGHRNCRASIGCGSGATGLE